MLLTSTISHCSVLENVGEVELKVSTMNLSRHHYGTLLLLFGVVLLTTVTLSQSGDRDLGIVRLRYVTIVVRDYDEALKWYTNVLGLEKTEDRKFGTDKRWLVVAPRGRKDIGIILEIAKPYSALDRGSNMSAATGNDSIRNYNARVGTETRCVFEVEDCRNSMILHRNAASSLLRPLWLSRGE